PFTTTIVMKYRHIQSTILQQMRAGTGLEIGLAADEYINVLKAGIIAGISHQRLTFHGFMENNALMRKTPQRRVFAWCGIRIKRINLHHPAKLMRFVAVILRGSICRCGGIKAAHNIGLWLCRMPVIFAVIGTNTVTVVAAWNIGITINKTIGPVFFAG